MLKKLKTQYSSFEFMVIISKSIVTKTGLEILLFACSLFCFMMTRLPLFFYLEWLFLILCFSLLRAHFCSSNHSLKTITSLVFEILTLSANLNFLCCPKRNLCSDFTIFLSRATARLVRQLSTVKSVGCITCQEKSPVP